MIVEPTGALGAAAAIAGTTPMRGARVGVILSGGNVDLGLVPTWLPVRGAQPC
jgi:threonine dehydratase